MDILKNNRVQEYLRTLNGKSPIQHVTTICQCMQNDFPQNAHCDERNPFSNNLVELATVNQSRLVMYITKTTYFSGNTMKYLLNEMLNCKNVEKVEWYNNVLEQNFKFHPPCAQYMNLEYEQLLLAPYRKYFMEMSLWDYLIENFKLMSNTSFLYGDDDVFALAFEKCLSFCVRVLQLNFEASKKNNFRPLIMKCLRYNPERRTRLHDISKLLNMAFNTGYDVQMSIIHLAILVNEIKI